MQNPPTGVFSGFEELGSRFYRAFFSQSRYLLYLDGVKITFQITFVAAIIGIVIGAFLAIIKVYPSDNPAMRFLKRFANLYTTVIRGTPVLLQLLIIYNMIFTSRDANVILIGGLGFGLNSGAYVTEIVRAGILAVDRGQMEAGRTLGFNATQTMRYIIMPQAVKNILPTLGNEFIVLIKETSVASVIAITDVTRAATLIGTRTYDVLPPYFIASGFYLIIVLLLQKGVDLLERRMSQGD